MNLSLLPREIQSIILDYKSQLETTQKFDKVLNRLMGNCTVIMLFERFQKKEFSSLLTWMKDGDFDYDIHQAMDIHGLHCKQSIRCNNCLERFFFCDCNREPLYEADQNLIFDKLKQMAGDDMGRQLWLFMILREIIE